MTGELVLTFDAPADPISMNEGDGRSVQERAKLWRTRAYYAWIEAHPGVGPSGRTFPTPAAVYVSIPFDVKRRRDPINFTKTVKHVVDGITLAGAWPDDTLDYVEQNIPTLTGPGPVVVRVVSRPS